MPTVKLQVRYIERIPRSIQCPVVHGVQAQGTCLSWCDFPLKAGGWFTPMTTVGCTIHHLQTSAHLLKSHEQNRNHDAGTVHVAPIRRMLGYASILNVVQEHVQQSSSSITAGNPCLCQ
jgi:hypothetical protein